MPLLPATTHQCTPSQPTPQTSPSPAQPAEPSSTQSVPPTTTPPPTQPQKSLDTLAAEHAATRRTARLRIKNRRKRYLDTHPSYFTAAALEYADPFLYQELIGRFAAATETAATQQAKRDEKATDAIGEGIVAAVVSGQDAGRDRVAALSRRTDLEMAREAVLRDPDPNSPLLYQRARDGAVVAVLPSAEDRVRTREEGMAKWREVMGMRFLRGGDGEFEYEGVDGDRGLDDWEAEDREDLERWVDGEEAQFVGEGSPKGETGVQDF